MPTVSFYADIEAAFDTFDHTVHSHTTSVERMPLESNTESETCQVSFIWPSPLKLILEVIMRILQQ